MLGLSTELALDLAKSSIVLLSATQYFYRIPYLDRIEYRDYSVETLLSFRSKINPLFLLLQTSI
jgi:hypothetical protein